ncbi:alpha/beta hydrolase [Bacillus sp. BRMEA1]|uniref:alpha/beta hydrolase fold domain-containing protein n=1 Tax=Neobacillus endophyticus TaxID=2738405 RepID=UPI0015673BCB|nr:alpha/beta hydrolase [Neobacillus endophyticus]NRD79511.1 alpha/beta hydrolase [Neobacillus endophyticus]
MGLIIERMLKEFKAKKRILLDEKNLVALMDQKRVENAKPYIFPKYLEQKFGIIKDTKNGMDSYILKGSSFPGDTYILYLHGGAYINQPTPEHWKFLQKLVVKINGTAMAPVYPKAPNHHVHESFEKVLPIYEELLSKTEPKNIVLMGDSSGGGFALALAQVLQEKGLPQPGNIILLFPWLDLTMTNPEINELDLEEKDPILGVKYLAAAGKAYAGDEDLSNYLLSPINGNMKGLGKISVFVGTHDILYVDARKLKEKADQLDVKINYYEFPNMIHGFTHSPFPEADRAFEKIVEIIQS